MTSIHGRANDLDSLEWCFFHVSVVTKVRSITYKYKVWCDCRMLWHLLHKIANKINNACSIVLVYLMLTYCLSIDLTGEGKGQVGLAHSFYWGVFK